MDNFRIDIVSEGDIIPALKIAFGRWNKASGYRIVKDKGFIVYSTNTPDTTPFPYDLNVEELAVFVNGWLKSQDVSTWDGVEPDHDGDNKPGWEIYNDDWGHVNGEWQAFVAIIPRWAMYGK